MAKKGRWAWRPTTRRLITAAGMSGGNRTMGNPFITLGLEYCRTCRSETDCDTDSSHRGGVYVFKRWCKRCGTVLKYGSYAAPLVSDRVLPAMAFEWVTKPERDRR